MDEMAPYVLVGLLGLGGMLAAVLSDSEKSEYVETIHENLNKNKQGIPAASAPNNMRRPLEYEYNSDVNEEDKHKEPDMRMLGLKDIIEQNRLRLEKQVLEHENRVKNQKVRTNFL